MATDCQVLSPKAREIFERLKPFFPPDPWKQPRWNEDGTVEDNGRYDLRQSADRQKLLEKMRSALAMFVETVAGVYKTNNGSLDGFEVDHFGLMIRNGVELLFVLRDLDFQIETGDLLDA